MPTMLWCATSRALWRIIPLIKFARSNAGTCINQRPIVEVGETVTAGQVLADGPAMRNGEVSLGKNALIGFMTWEGYNYEDAVLLNEKIVREDVYTSIHIEESTRPRAAIPSWDPEEITRDIPNVSEDALKDLDERGIIRIGAEVRRATSWSARSPRRARPSSPPKSACFAPSSARRHAKCVILLCAFHTANTASSWMSRFYPRRTATSCSPVSAKWCAATLLRSAKSAWATRWPAATATKGVVSRILPQEDMPFLEDGTRWTSCSTHWAFPAA